MKISKRLAKEMASLLEKQAEISNKTGVKNIQSNRFVRDCIIGNIIDKDIDMNTNLHGWDGILSNGTYFENKNTKAKVRSGISFGLRLQDTSLDKLNELENGVFISNTFWDDGKPAFLLVGNTRNVSHHINASYNPGSRKTSTVSMFNCLKNGFKFVAVNYKKQEVWDTLASKFPKIGTVMSINDICTEKDIPELLAEMS
jgi:hypothetical protein